MSTIMMKSTVRKIMMLIPGISASYLSWSNNMWKNIIQALSVLGRFVTVYIQSTFSAWSTEVKNLLDKQQGMLARVLAVAHIQTLKVASYK